MSLDPRLSAMVVEAVDQRFKQLAAMQPKTAYGVVASLNTTTRTAAVYLGGDTTASGGFKYGTAKPVVGELVRVVIDSRGDRYIEDMLGPPHDRPIEAAGLVAPSVALVRGMSWYSTATTVALTGGVDTALHSSYEVTYPGNPDMAGYEVIMQVWAQLSFTLSVGSQEFDLNLFSDPEDNTGGSIRLAFIRQRVNTASAMYTVTALASSRWDAEDSVRFYCQARAASSCTFTPYGSSAAYVSRIGYNVLGYAVHT